MKKSFITLLLFFLGLTLSTSAQQTKYNNEWIDFDKTYYKIKVGNNGLHRVHYETLVAAGLPIDPKGYVLYHHGEETPIYICSGPTLQEGDFIEFYGKLNDGCADTELYEKDIYQPNNYHSLFSDSSTYYLTWDDQKSHIRYEDMPNTPFTETLGKADIEPYFITEKVLQPQFSYHTGKPTLIEADYDLELGEKTKNYIHNFADFEQGEGFSSLQLKPSSPLIFDLNTPHIYRFADEQLYRFETNFINTGKDASAQGAYLYVTINGEQFGGTSSNNYLAHMTQLVDLKEKNQVTLSAEDVGDNTKAITYVKVQYPRTFDFDQEQAVYLELAHHNQTALVLNNFNGGEAPVLYDIIHKNRIIGTLENDQYVFYLPGYNRFGLRYLLISSMDAQEPNPAITAKIKINQEPTLHISSKEVTQLSPIQFTDFSKNTHQGNYLLITHPKILNADGASSSNETKHSDYTAPVYHFKAHKESPAGGSHKVVIADVEELYDQFAFGIQTHPVAIRNFVNLAVDQWTTSPDYLMLVGNALSYNKRYNDNYYTDCLVPSYGYPASDNKLVCRKGSNKMQVAVGRVPASNKQEAEYYFKKVIEYENADLCDLSDNQWRKKALFTFNSFSETFFQESEQKIQQHQDALKTADWQPEINTYGQLGADKITRQTDFEQAMKEGAAFVSHWGHGSDDFTWHFDIKKAAHYENQGKYPLISSFTNLNGAIFDQRSYCQMIDFIVTPNAGAIGYLAPNSFYSIYSETADYNEIFYQTLFNEGYNQSIGKIIQQVNQKELTDPNLTKLVQQQLIYAGDPSVVITPYAQPEFAINPTQINFYDAQTGVELEKLTPEIEAFEVRATITNLGRQTSDSITIQILKEYRDGSRVHIAQSKIPSPNYQTTYSTIVQNENEDILKFVVGFNANAAIEETCDDNTNNFDFHYFGKELECEGLDGGTIQTPEAIDTYEFCFGTGDDYRITFTNNSTTTAANYRYLLVDETGTIISLATDSYEFGNVFFGEGDFFIYGVAYDNSVAIGRDGLSNLTAIQADDCANLSTNFIRVNINTLPKAPPIGEKLISLCNEKEFGNHIYDLYELTNTLPQDTFIYDGQWTSDLALIDGRFTDLSDQYPGQYAYHYKDQGSAACADVLAESSILINLRDCDNQLPILQEDVIRIPYETESITFNPFENDSDPDQHPIYLVDAQLENESIGSLDLEAYVENGQITFHKLPEVEGNYTLIYTATDYRYIDWENVNASDLVTSKVTLILEPRLLAPGVCFSTAPVRTHIDTLFTCTETAPDFPAFAAFEIEIDTSNSEFSQVRQIIHTDIDAAHFGTIYFDNQLDSLDDQWNSIPYNTPLYVSTIGMHEKNNCQWLFETRPFVRLEKISFTIIPNECACYYDAFTIEISGGLPGFDPKEQYTFQSADGDISFPTELITDLSIPLDEVSRAFESPYTSVSDRMGFIAEPTIITTSCDADLYDNLLSKDTIFVCHTDIATAQFNTARQDLIENISTETLQYILHDEADAFLGNLYAQNNDGIFSLERYPTLVTNNVYYLSAVDINAPTGGKECAPIFKGMPVVFLDPITLASEESECEAPFGKGTLLLSFEGGFANFDPTSSYSLKGNITANIAVNEIVGFSGEHGESAEVIVTDAYGCTYTYTDEFNCDPYDVIETDINIICDYEDDCQYNVALQIEGGSPPYTINGIYQGELANEGVVVFKMPQYFADVHIVIKDSQGNETVVAEKLLHCLHDSPVDISCVQTCEGDNALNVDYTLECIDNDPDHAIIHITTTGGTAPIFFYDRLAVKDGDRVALNDPFHIMAYDFYGCSVGLTGTFDGSNCYDFSVGAPVAQDDDFSIQNNEPSSFNVLANDEAEGAVIVAVNHLGEQVNGELNISADGLALTYTPRKNFTGVDLWEYTIENFKGEQSTAFINIKVYSDRLVWPGDTDGSGSAGLYDLLQIGLGHGFTGPPRVNPVTDWVGQEAFLWDDYYIRASQDSTNFNHADADGNGIINEMDKDCILQNYNHQISGKTANTILNDSVNVSLYWEVEDTIIENHEHVFSINLGTPDSLANNVYGIAFRAGIIVSSSDTIQLNAPMVSFANSWLGTEGVDMITLDTLFSDVNKWDIAMTRTNHIPQTGAYEVCRIGCIMVMGSLKTALDELHSIPLTLTFEHVKIITVDGDEIPVNAFSKTIVLTQESPTVVEPPTDEIEPCLERISLSPNPATTHAYLNYEQCTPSRHVDITIYNLNGQAIKQHQFDAEMGNHELSINVSNLPIGCYFVEIQDGVEKVTKRLVVTGN